MKKILTIAFILASLCSFSQQPFQGTIQYSFKINYKEEEMKLTAQFGTNVIRLWMEEKGREKKDISIINLDSGKIFTLNIATKTYKSKKIFFKTPDDLSPAPVIAGYPTNKLRLQGSGSIIGRMFSAMAGGNAVLFESRDLYFPVSQFQGAKDLMIVSNDHIVLGAEIPMNFAGMMNEGEEDTAAGNKLSITIMATDVNKTPVPATEFLIPDSFTLAKPGQLNFDDELVDTITNNSVSDTVWSKTENSPGAPPVQKKKTTPKKNPPVKKTNAVKPVATKPKRS